MLTISINYGIFACEVFGVMATYSLSKKEAKILASVNEAQRIARQNQNCSLNQDWCDILEIDLAKHSVQFRELDPASIHAIDEIGWNLYRIASSTTLNLCKQRIKAFASDASLYLEHLHFIPNKDFGLVPVRRRLPAHNADVDQRSMGASIFKKSEREYDFIWAACLTFGRKIAAHPKRLKICPFCRFLFWDGKTRPGNKHTCGKVECQKRWNAQRAKQHYHRRKAVQATASKRGGE